MGVPAGKGSDGLLNGLFSKYSGFGVNEVGLARSGDYLPILTKTSFFKKPAAGYLLGAGAMQSLSQVASQKMENNIKSNVDSSSWYGGALNTVMGWYESWTSKPPDNY